jgi:hypothetical protein
VPICLLFIVHSLFEEALLKKISGATARVPVPVKEISFSLSTMSNSNHYQLLSSESEYADAEEEDLSQTQANCQMEVCPDEQPQSGQEGWNEDLHDDLNNEEVDDDERAHLAEEDRRRKVSQGPREVHSTFVFHSTQVVARTPGLGRGGGLGPPTMDQVGFLPTIQEGCT